MLARAEVNHFGLCQQKLEESRSSIKLGIHDHSMSDLQFES